QPVTIRAMPPAKGRTGWAVRPTRHGPGVPTRNVTVTHANGAGWRPPRPNRGVYETESVPEFAILDVNLTGSGGGFHLGRETGTHGSTTQVRRRDPRPGRADVPRAPR